MVLFVTTFEQDRIVSLIRLNVGQDDGRLQDVVVHLSLRKRAA